MKMRRIEKKGDTELLEELRIQTGAEYISSLRYSPYREAANSLIRKIPPNRYPKAVWQDAYAYLAEDGRQI